MTTATRSSFTYTVGFSMKKNLLLLRGLTALVILVLAGGAASAQGLPMKNHYKTYEVTPITLPTALILKDQFGTVTVSSMAMTKFAIPAEKNGEPIIDPKLHYTWWNFFVPQPVRTVNATDQFGFNEWTVADALYLLAPALKNAPLPPPGPPIANHYLCYEASGPTLGFNVTLKDQVDSVSVSVLFGKFFCNPVEKTLPGDITFPVVDSLAHLTCYLVQNPRPYDVPVIATDQFNPGWQLRLHDNLCLCVPALKEELPVPTEESTWGELKSNYR